jgi:quercetin dioxygenase-like cupin family protein
MRNWVMLGCALAVAGGVGLSVSAQVAAPIKSQPKELLTAPLTGDASREVKVLSVLLPAGADSGRHIHHGDQFTTVQEGEIHIDIDGKGDQVFKAGDAVHISPMVVHRTQNLSGKPARTTELFIVAKDKPLGEPADQPASGSSSR